MEALVFPPKVAAGIVKVSAAAEKLYKTNHNKFAGYNFVSVDDMFGMYGPIMASAGISILAHEKSASVQNKILEVDYDIYIIHESGESAGPISRSIQLQATGPQAYGSAESYVLKQFMRGLFKIPTNETEEDSFKKDHDLPDRSKKQDNKTSKPEMFDVQKSIAERDRLKKLLKECANDQELGEWSVTHSVALACLQPADHKLMLDAYYDQQKANKLLDNYEERNVA